MTFPASQSCWEDQTRPRVCRACPGDGAYSDAALFSVSWSTIWSGRVGAQNLLLLGAMEDSWNQGQGQRILLQILFSLFLVVCDLNKSLYVSAPHHPWVRSSRLLPPCMVKTLVTMPGLGPWSVLRAPLSSELVNLQGCQLQRASCVFRMYRAGR